MLWLQLHSNRGTQEMASFISWGNQFYTIIRTQLLPKWDFEDGLILTIRWYKGLR